MKKNMLFIAVCMFCVILISCSTEEAPGKVKSSATTTIPDSKYHVCDELEIQSYPGTSCCVSGPIQAHLGDTLSFAYQSNTGDSIIVWEITGSIIIVDGQNSKKASFKFGNDFTTGTVIANGQGENLCTSTIAITSLE